MQVYTHVFTLLVAALASLVPGLGSWATRSVTEPFGSSMEGQAEATVRRTVAWASGAGTARVLELSNLNGSIFIVAEDRADVAVTARRTVERMGREPVPQVDVRPVDAKVLVCADSTRCGCRLGSGPQSDWRSKDDSTVVRVDFEVRVPRAVTLDVCAVNTRLVRVEGTSGPYSIHNVNGDVRLARVGGHGDVRTVNGNVEATFLRVPDGPGRFSSVNGDLDVTMPASLAADVRMHTMHGDLYTGFDTTPMPRRAATTTRRGGSTIYRQDGHASMRIGAGGHELVFETFNGDVRLRRQ